MGVCMGTSKFDLLMTHVVNPKNMHIS